MRTNETWSTIDALSQTRREHAGILAPASDEDAGHISKKRRRNGTTMEELLDEPFVVKPYPSTVFVKPRSLIPVALLRRSDLPLSSLDLHASTSNPLPNSRLFEAHVKILELEQRMGSTPMILVARLDDEETFYAVEYMARGLYVVLRLGSWIDMDKLSENAVLTTHKIQKSTTDGIGEDICLRKASNRSQIITPESSKYNKKKRLAIEAIQSMVKRPPGVLLPIVQETLVPMRSPEAIPEKDAAVIENEPIVDSVWQLIVQDAANPDQKTEPVNILDSIRIQYFETLYLSKASLAYFPKGPLSRARAAFHLDIDSTLNMKDLIEFLESMVLSLTVLDKKYKDSVADLVSTMSIEPPSADELQGKASTKKQKNRKIKLGKNGLYPTEDTFVRRWYQGYDKDVDFGIPGTELVDSIRSRITQLRVREVQLQMIVILETLALRPIFHATQEVDLPFISKEELFDDKAKVSSKAKKSRDLTGLLHAHVDRLCIWQSVADEEGKSTTTDKDVSGGILGIGSHAADVLRDFCGEVVVPFFSARLPEECAMISRKLGGPVVLSPVRPRLSKSSSASVVQTRPGAVTKRPIATKSHRSLRRVLTDERTARSGSRGPSGTISLMRSATAPSVPGLKREASETPSLSSIQVADTQSMFASRGGVQKSKKFSQREVDLSSLLRASDQKSKKSIIDAELKDAILALKRPNRQLAGQSIVETAEKRVSSTTHSRKSKKPVRNPLFQGVQIMATPKAHRQKDMMIEMEPFPRLETERSSTAFAASPQSSMPRIPQSAVRPPPIRGLEVNTICINTPVRTNSTYAAPSIIETTPSRVLQPPVSNITNSFTSHGMQVSHGHPPLSPLVSRKLDATKSHEMSKAQFEDLLTTPTRSKVIHASPIALGNGPRTKMSLLDLVSFPNIAGKDSEGGIFPREMENGGTGEESIYKSLGWDDMDEPL